VSAGAGAGAAAAAAALTLVLSMAAAAAAVAVPTATVSTGKARHERVRIDGIGESGLRFRIAQTRKEGGSRIQHDVLLALRPLHTIIK
jgi:cobalamin biosynthesis protein CbiD